MSHADGTKNSRFTNTAGSTPIWRKCNVYCNRNCTGNRAAPATMNHRERLYTCPASPRRGKINTNIRVRKPVSVMAANWMCSMGIKALFSFFPFSRAKL